MLNNFKHYKLFLESKFQGVGRQLSGKISEQLQNDVIQQKRDMT